jgi:hypothetical protein
MKDNMAFLDLLFNMLLLFALFFVISFAMIKPMVKKADAKNNAEFLISVTWDDDNKDDIDTWLQDPLGDIVWYQQKEKNMSHLDRDDLGHLNDTIIMPDGSMVTCKRNQELTSIRGFIPGEWVLNLHAYKRRQKAPTIVKVSLDKINPSLKTLFFKEVIMEEQWQETTVTRFTMTVGGDIVAWDSLAKELIEDRLRGMEQ